MLSNLMDLQLKTRRQSVFAKEGSLWFETSFNGLV